MMRALIALAVCAWALPSHADQLRAFRELQSAAGQAVVPEILRITEIRTRIIEVPMDLYIPKDNPIPQWPARRCPKPLCTGDKVATDTGYLGTVAGSFPDGRVSVSIPYSKNGTYARSQIAVTWGCNRQSCVGDPAASADGTVQILLGIFPDGRLALSTPGFSLRSETYAPSNVAGIRRCSDGLCSGSDTVTDDGFVGTVFGVFGDGRVGVRFGTENRVAAYGRWQLVSTGCQ